MWSKRLYHPLISASSCMYFNFYYPVLVQRKDPQNLLLCLPRCPLFKATNPLLNKVIKLTFSIPFVSKTCVSREFHSQITDISQLQKVNTKDIILKFEDKYIVFLLVYFVEFLLHLIYFYKKESFFKLSNAYFENFENCNETKILFQHEPLFQIIIYSLWLPGKRVSEKF